tara:strand:- start:107 stop:370 length:264 start_codon:yes stop_codon:yes gene_type:complete
MRIILLLTIFIFNTNFLYAEDKCKNVGILQIKKSKECLNMKKTNDTKQENPSKASETLQKIKSGSKNALGKLNTDSKLTDFLKKKLP